jgi:NAD(P)-dependent dehydrogenase (short-subunit alcohol dehydrogenase family)
MSSSIIITGSGRGIGAATADLAAQRGYAVCVNYRERRESADAVVGKIRQAGGKAIAVKGENCVEADVVRLFDTAERELGPVRALVNNAGVPGRIGRVENLELATLRRVLDVNVIGTVLCAREAVRRMSTKHGGRGGAIVNVSSAAAKLGSPGDYVDYAASKAAIETFTVGLAKEVGGEGIRVNCVRPGVIRTDIHLVSGDPSRVERIGGAAPLGRPGEPEEVARAILFLASDEASYTTGAVLDVTGGR